MSIGPKKGRLAGLIAANENRSQSRQSNTTNTAANQPSNANNPPTNILVAVLDQNLSISAASAAALLQSQEIQSSGTHDDMDTSQNDINDSNTINNDLSNQQPNLLVLPILPNQNLALSAASAAALSLPQDIQSSATNDAMDISHDDQDIQYSAANDAMDISHDAQSPLDSRHRSSSESTLLSESDSVIENNDKRKRNNNEDGEDQYDSDLDLNKKTRSKRQKQRDRQKANKKRKRIEELENKSNSSKSSSSVPSIDLSKVPGLKYKAQKAGGKRKLTRGMIRAYEKEEKEKLKYREQIKEQKQKAAEDDAKRKVAAETKRKTTEDDAKRKTKEELDKIAKEKIKIVYEEAANAARNLSTKESINERKKRSRQNQSEEQNSITRAKDTGNAYNFNVTLN